MTQQNQPQVDSQLSDSQTKNRQILRPWLYRPKKSAFGTSRSKTYNSKQWSLEQNYRYALFLKEFKHLILGETCQKRKNHLSRMMSKTIETRSPIQCRSHHQQILKIHGSVEEIIRQMLKPDREEENRSQTQEPQHQKPEKQVEVVSFEQMLNFQLICTQEFPSVNTTQRYELNPVSLLDSSQQLFQHDYLF